MAYHESTFSSADGLKLFVRMWQVDAPRANVLLVHGYAEHSGRYAHVAESLNQAGYSLLTYDWRGHGMSGGMRAYVERFGQYVADLKGFIAHVSEAIASAPVFLMGHSAGGLVTLRYALQHQPNVKGLILSSPALKLPADLSPVLQKVSGLLGALAPKLQTVKLDSTLVSRDPAIVSYHQTNPLMYTGGTRARTGAELVKATRQIQHRFKEVEYPFYIFHGTADRITDPEGSKQLYNKAQSTDKTLKLFEGFYHETMNEPEKAQVLSDLVAWISARLPN